MPERPHIVFITADQMRFNCLSCHGNLGVRTPHLDALARESVVFDLKEYPQESRSLAGEPQYADRKHALRGKRIQWMRETDDLLDLERDAGFTPADWAHRGRPA